MLRFLAIALLSLRCAGAATPEVKVATIVSFTEGPTVYQDGSVFFTETRGNRIMKLAPDGQLTVFRENSNAANGLIFDSQWRLLACEGSDNIRKQPRLTRTDLKTGKMEILADHYNGKPLNSPNDVTIDGKGRIFFTDPVRTGGGSVYRIDPNGRLTQILTEPQIQQPNGIVVSPDDRILYLIESNSKPGGARMIRAYDLQPDGSVTNMRVFHNFFPGRSADGMTVDSQGNVVAAAGLNRPRGTSETLDTKCGVYFFSPQGKLLQFVPIPEDTITNVAFGGPDLKTLYVTAGKTLFSFRTEIAGTRR